MLALPCRSLRIAACTLVLATLPAGAEILKPDQVAGLAAWYELETVHRRAHDGSTLERWPDESGNGHDLVSVRKETPPVFRTKVVNGKPAVTLHRANRFDVVDPFELHDHTIFLVYRTELSKRALLSSETDDRLGLILAEEGRFHSLQDGKNGALRYNRLQPSAEGFRVTVLGRERGSLRCFVNGHDLSSGLTIATPLRVGRLFEIRHTTYVVSDGAGLTIAEMIFFDRYLPEVEREGIARHLSEKYALPFFEKPVPEIKEKAEVEIDEEAVRLRASTRSAVKVNEGIVAIPWDLVGPIEGPFHFGAGADNSRLYSRADGARVRLTATLELSTKVVEAQVRLLFQIQRGNYLPDDAISGPFRGQGDDKVSQVRLQAEMTLNDGDFVEVITTREAAAGAVQVPAGGALLIVERIE